MKGLVFVREERKNQSIVRWTNDFSIGLICPHGTQTLDWKDRHTDIPFCLPEHAGEPAQQALASLLGSGRSSWVPGLLLGSAVASQVGSARLYCHVISCHRNREVIVSIL